MLPLPYPFDREYMQLALVAELVAKGVSLGVHAEDLPLWLEDMPD